ncbi:MFS transporter [Flavobacterium sp. NKUCC04_CG]|uniref:MFS transporter n=1 Tax=Flavobacterium sp. NKUCC04_CG TaxID=2842121 RepID=UPI001C5BF6C7|nr:MFS transporter [Flavobacterium sp. NKUCC04_CG]MBW3519126.1 MFS transporter [Flavobacterium sp. NKUCC04_CG]
MLTLASPQRKKTATLLAFMLIPLSGLVTDIYLPSFPAMARDLGLLEKNIQLTLSCFLLSYGIGQLFIGSLLDSIGRYKPSLIALIILVISSVLIGISRDLFVICFLRVVQGFSIAAIVVSKRAFFVDLYSGDQLKYYLSYFTIAWSCGPIVAPFLGGYLEKAFGWQSNFYFLALYALLMFALELIYSGETLATKKPFKGLEVLQVYKMMLSSGNFVLGVFILGLSYSVVMVFSMAGPFIIEHTFNFNAVTIGYCALALGVSWMIGGLLGKRSIHWNFRAKVIGFAFFQLLLIALMLGIGQYYQNLPVLMFFAFIIHICSGFIFNVYFTRSMIAFPNNAGIAGGLLGGLIYVLTSILSYVVSSTGSLKTQNDIAWRYLCMSGLLFVVILVWMRIRTKKIVD